MDLTFTEKQQAFRAEARAWLEANVPAEPLRSFDTEEGFRQHREWEAKLNEGRWGMVTWPEELGGRGCDLIEWLVFEEEYYRAGAPLRVNQNGIFLLGPTLMEYGTDEQKARFLPKMATGEEIWCQGWSEPNAGSDMAAIRSRAERDGDHYVINGQKTWSTRAVWAHAFHHFAPDPGSRHGERLARGRKERRHPGGVGGLVLRHVSHRPGVRTPSRAHLHPGAAGYSGYHGAADPPAGRPARLCRDLL